MSRRILLADDSVTIQKVIELTFMDDDFEVKAVGNGDEAVAFLASNPVDFVISDVHMPGANGYEVCRRAKELRPGIPVLLLVGTFEPFDENQARACGANSFLKKPFDSQELLQRVHELLGPEPGAQTASVEPAGAPAAGAAPAGAPAAPAAAEPEPRAAAEPVEPPPSLLGFTTTPEPAAAEPAAAPEWHGFELEAEPEKPEKPEDGALEAHAHTETSAPTGPMAATAPMPPWSQPPPPAPAMPAEARPFTLADEPAHPAAGPSSEPHDQPFTLGEPLDERDFRLSPSEPLAPSMRAGFEIEPEPQPFSLEEEEGPAAASADFDGGGGQAGIEPSERAAAVPAADNGSGPGVLSEGDVDRIARRVVELIGDKVVRDVAWEVIPDLAEVVIKDRLRELEGQVE